MCPTVNATRAKISAVTKAEKILTAIIDPSRVLVAIWKRLAVGPFSLRMKFDAVVRPHYAYGVYWAAIQAKRLGIQRISVVEFGVAGGNGLVILEQHAEAVEKELGIGIDVYGFDRIEGLPAGIDYRDMPYWFKAGSYQMDVDALKKRLHRTELVLGDVAETVSTFAATRRPSPIGFVAFDVDIYSSTKHALGVFHAADDFLLPRVICYFDDVTGWDWFFGTEFTGERLAIAEFNKAHARQKISRIYGLESKRFLRCRWGEHMFAFHRFNHRRYNDYVADDPSLHLLALEERPS
jgi:hypothetical protein